MMNHQQLLLLPSQASQSLPNIGAHEQNNRHRSHNHHKTIVTAVTAVTTVAPIPNHDCSSQKHHHNRHSRHKQQLRNSPAYYLDTTSPHWKIAV